MTIAELIHNLTEAIRRGLATPDTEVRLTLDATELTTMGMLQQNSIDPPTLVLSGSDIPPMMLGGKAVKE